MLLRWGPWLVALVAVALAAATLWRPDSVAQRLGLGAAVVQRQHDAWRQQLRAHYRRLDANTPAGATIFLGASTVQGLNAAQVRACHANFGIGGETARELVARLDDYGSLDRAAAVVVMTGLNDVLRRDDADLADHYRRLLARLPADPPVILSSLPRLSPATERGRSFAPAVVRANEQARAACGSRHNCRFVDLHGAMSPLVTLTERDGIHLDAAGYALWSRLLRDALAATGVGERPCRETGGS
jgi:lysophospholipase L1-like esterase